MGSITQIDPSPTWPNKLRLTSDTALNPVGFSGTWVIGNPTWVLQHSLNAQQAALGDNQNGQFPVIVPGSSDLQFELAFGQQGPNLGSVYFAWNLDETSGTTCESGSTPVNDLTANGGDPDGVEIVDGAWQKARRFSGDTAEVLQSDATPGGFGINGEAAFAAFVLLEGGRTDPATICSIQGDPSNMADGADNEQFRVQIETDGTITWAWEHGTRVLETGTTTRGLQVGRGVFLIVRRDGSNDVSVIVNGEVWQTWTSVTPPDGGDSADMRIGLGRQAVDTVNPFKGIIDQPQFVAQSPLNDTLIAQAMRLTVMPIPINVPLSTQSQSGFNDMGGNPSTPGFFYFIAMAAEYRTKGILNTPAADYESLAVPDGSSDAVGTPPTVDGFSPALASAITSVQPISFDVTRNSGSEFRRIVVMVSFPFLDIYEIAHDGDAFSQNYPALVGNAKATVSADTEYHFTLLRKEGWPASPRISVLAIDDAGGITDITSVIYAWTLI